MSGGVKGVRMGYSGVKEGSGGNYGSFRNR